MKLALSRNCYQYIATFTGTLGIISSEMHYGWPSPSLPVLLNGTYIFQVTSEESSWLTIMPMLGAIIGAACTGLIIDRTGRKKLIVFSSLPFFIAWILIGVARSSVLIFISRFIAGLCDGLSFTAVPMYIGEIADPKIRGFLGSVLPVSIVFGILLINILGSFLSISTTAFISSVIPVLLLLTFSWMPESPYYLLMREKYADAKISLQRFRGYMDVEEELLRLSIAVKEQNENSGKFWDLFRMKSNRRALCITLGLRTVQLLSGAMVITFYCKTIFNESNSFVPSHISPIIFFSIQLVLSAISSSIVDISGRRPLLIISVIGTSLSLFATGIFLYIKNCTEIDTAPYSFIPLISMISFIIIFSIGLQTIPLLMMGEMFPTNVKASALCLADIYFSITVSIISKFFHATKDTFGMHVPFFTFGTLTVLGLFFIIFVIPETKGKTLEDIQSYLKR